jgi:hypothetical protein
VFLAGRSGLDAPASTLSKEELSDNAGRENQIEDLLSVQGAFLNHAIKEPPSSVIF